MNHKTHACYLETDGACVFCYQKPKKPDKRVFMFGEARGTFAYASHPPLCTARSGRLEPLAAVMSNGHYVYTLAPFRVRAPRNVRNVKNPTSGFSGFGEARGTFAYASHPPLCTARSGRLEPLAAVMSNGHYVYTLAPFRVRAPRNVRNVKNPTSGFSGFGEARGTRTPNRQIRSLRLYPLS